MGMRIFIDTEFIDTEFTTTYIQIPLAIGIAAEGGQIFYAEQTGYRQENCTSFVRSDVITLLGRESAATCTATELSRRFYEWFRTLPEAATILLRFRTGLQLLEASFLGPLPGNLASYELVDHKYFDIPLTNWAKC